MIWLKTDKDEKVFICSICGGKDRIHFHVDPVTGRTIFGVNANDPNEERKKPNYFGE